MLFFIFLFMNSLLASWTHSLIIFGSALWIFKSYDNSLRLLLRKHYSLILMILFYQGLGHIGRSFMFISLVEHIVIIVSSLIIALMFNTLLDDRDMIANVSFYLSPFKNLINIDTIILSIILFRCYLRLLKQNWNTRRQAIELRLSSQSYLHKQLIILRFFLLDILEYPRQITHLLYLRGYHSHIIGKSYPYHKSDILYFLIFCGILGLVYLW
ncbi:hypothetical protein PVA45_03460 [Entomospira entomophila]|nr:hypothetical protein PVA45_03460 [Entomospira entomophilus]